MLSYLSFLFFGTLHSFGYIYYGISCGCIISKVDKLWLVQMRWSVIIVRMTCLECNRNYLDYRSLYMFVYGMYIYVCVIYMYMYVDGSICYICACICICMLYMYVYVPQLPLHYCPPLWFLMNSGCFTFLGQLADSSGSESSELTNFYIF